MAESNDARAASPDAPAPTSSKGSKLIVILALVNFIAVLGMGGYMFYQRQHAAAQPDKAKAEKDKKEGGHGEQAAEHGADPAEEQAAEHGAPAAEHGEPAAEGRDEAAGGHARDEEEPKASPYGDEAAGKGPLLALESMVTNLSDPDTDRYLKVVMQLRLTSEAARVEVEAQLVPVRNQILLYLSSLTIADTTGAENKRAIQKRVKRIANESMQSSRITQVYFTEFVIQ